MRERVRETYRQRVNRERWLEWTSERDRVTEEVVAGMRETNSLLKKILKLKKKMPDNCWAT